MINSMKNITSITLIILAVLVFFFLIDGKYKDIQKLQAEITKNDEILETANKLKLKKEELNTKFNQISQTEKEQLEKLIPDTVDNVRLIIDINNIANQFGITIRDISINSKEAASKGVAKTSTSNDSNFDGVLQDGTVKYVDQSKIGVISFSFSVSAKYEVFLEFLKKLEESLRVVDIRNIEVSRGNDSVFYDYKVTMETYWLK